MKKITALLFSIIYFYSYGQFLSPGDGTANIYYSKGNVGIGRSDLYNSTLTIGGTNSSLQIINNAETNNDWGLKLYQSSNRSCVVAGAGADLTVTSGYSNKLILGSSQYSSGFVHVPGGSMKFGDLSSVKASIDATNGNASFIGKVGIGTSQLSSNHKLTVDGGIKVSKNAISGREDNIISVSVSDAPLDGLEIGNGTILDNQFMPCLVGTKNSDSRIALFLSAESDISTGADPLMVFDTRTAAGAKIITRPLFAWKNYDELMMQLKANGKLGIGCDPLYGKVHISGNGENEGFTIFKDGTTSGSTFRMYLQDQIAYMTRAGNETSGIAISKTGNVSIGIAVPDADAKLSVAPTNGDIIAKFYGKGTFDKDRLTIVQPMASSGNVFSIYTLNDDVSGSYGKIKIGHSSTTNALMVDGATGQVGIGTDPSVSLDINGTDAICIPAGYQGTRPAVGVAREGMIRYNSGVDRIEYFKNSSWSSISDLDDFLWSGTREEIYTDLSVNGVSHKVGIGTGSLVTATLDINDIIPELRLRTEHSGISNTSSGRMFYDPHSETTYLSSNFMINYANNIGYISQYPSRDSWYVSMSANTVGNPSYYSIGRISEESNGDTFSPDDYSLFTIVNSGNVGIGTTDPECATGMHMYQDRYTLYGPNTTWGEYLRVGGNGNIGDGIAAVCATNGNLHLDAATGHHTYINHYNQGYTYINTGGGLVGIGTNSPDAKLSVYVNTTATTYSDVATLGKEVNGGEALALSLFNSGTSQFENNSVSMAFHNASHWNPTGKITVAQEGDASKITSSMIFHTYNNSNEDYLEERMRINSVGQVGIGTTTIPDNYLLGVNGGIAATRVTVKTGPEWGWSDFVFNEDYELKPLEEVEKFVAKNKHLPDVPSEAEVTKDGIDLGRMDAVLLQKVEELTLYMIEQNKQIEAQNKKHAEQEAIIKELQAEIKAMKGAK